MSTLRSYFRKKHKYETQADLKDMTAEQIVSLNPSDVGTYIEGDTGGVPLQGVKKRALYNLLAQKRAEKESGHNPTARQRVIDDFLKREGLRNDPQVTKLLVDTNTEILRERVNMKEMENRLRKLRDEAEIPYTEEEKMHLRLSKLNYGGKTRRKIKRKKTRRIRTRSRRRIGRRIGR